MSFLYHPSLYSNLSIIRLLLNFNTISSPELFKLGKDVTPTHFVNSLIAEVVQRIKYSPGNNHFESRVPSPVASPIFHS